MNLTDAVNMFAVRLYDWSVRDLCRELEAACPLLSLIGQHNRSVGAFVSWSKTLCPGERVELAHAMPLLFHENARNIKREAITPEIERWGEAFYEETTVQMEKLPPLLSADRKSPTFRPPSMDRVLDTVSSSVSSAFGDFERAKAILRCTRKIDDWKLVTEFAYAKKENNLIFEYQFIRADGAPVTEVGHGPFPRNLLSFYGIYPHTVVQVPSQADCEPMAKAMVRLAEHFVSQADPLFTGLGMED